MAKAIILCGGKGTRLRPYTYSVPKPMLRLGKRPILEFVINTLKSNGFRDIIITLGYRSDQIQQYFGDGSKFGVKIKYSVESEENPLNTAGSLLPLKSDLKESFLVVMGDHLTSMNLKAFFENHKKSGCIASMAFKKTGVPLEYGVAHLDGKNRVTRFEEKPIVQNFVSAGIYALEPGIFECIRERDDFAKNVFPCLLEKKEAINGYVFEEYWLDIGRTSDYEQLNETISTIDFVMHHSKVRGEF